MVSLLKIVLGEQGKQHFKTGTAKHKFNLSLWQAGDEAKVSFKNGHLYAVVKRMGRGIQIWKYFVPNTEKEA